MLRSRFWRRTTAVLMGAVAGLFVIFAGGPAGAHTVLVGTDPPDGAVLQAPPDDITITFNEPIQIADGTTLLTADGSELDVSAVAVDDQVVLTPDASLPDGTYVVSWRVISQDSHPVAGAFSFSVGAPSATGVDLDVAEPTAALDTARAIDQAVVYIGTFLVAGLVVFELLVLRVAPGASPVLRRRTHRLRVAGLAVAGLALVASVPLTAAWQAGGGLGTVVEPATFAAGITSDTAVAGALGLVGLLAATVAAARAGRTRRGAGPERQAVGATGLALGGTVIALGSLLVVGHTRSFGPAWLVLSSDLLHVVAGAVWLGGVVGLALTLAPRADVEPRAATITVTRFSTLGAWLVAALALTGIALAWRILGTFEALVSTAYGSALLVKVGLVVGIVAIAAWNRFRLVPAVTMLTGHEEESAASEGRTPTEGHAATARHRLMRTVSTEAVLLVVVLLVTGVLVSNSPVGDPATGSEPATHDGGHDDMTHDGVEVTEDLDDGTVRARLTPGRAGDNSLEIELLDADGDPVEPIAVPELTATLADPAIGPFTHSLTETGPGTYEATLDLTIPGSWTVTLSVRTSKFDNPIVDIPVEVAP